MKEVRHFFSTLLLISTFVFLTSAQDSARVRCLEEMCDLFCEFGNVLDRHGCPLCQCNQNPAPCSRLPPCRLYCEFGYVSDENGCQLCSCLNDPCLKYELVRFGLFSHSGFLNPCAEKICSEGEVCRNKRCMCKEGVRCPENLYASCEPTLEPTPPKCPVLYPEPDCPYGQTYDGNDCPTAECHDPCANLVCPDGEVCRRLNAVCKKAPCYNIGQCFRKDEPVICFQHNRYPSCKYGIIYDSDDCPTTKCYEPCEGIDCPIGDVCRGVEVICVKAPCYPQPQCFPDFKPIEICRRFPCPVLEVMKK